MILDRSTYEAWLLDRLEGHLTPEQERELDAFLAANPDLPAGLGELPRVEGSVAVFGAKDKLKRVYPPTGRPDIARLDDFLVARLEGDLSARQEQQLDRLLYEHPERVQDARRMAASRVPRTPIPFTAKGTVERHFPPQGLPDRHRLTDFLIAAQEGVFHPISDRRWRDTLMCIPMPRVSNAWWPHRASCRKRSSSRRKSF
ncbi:MAG: hypothetical protein QM724_02560 [Flavobacteriales bacterium]